MSIAIIVARSRNGVIGKDNTLPWHLPEDLRHFKAVTMGKPMIMGRKTFESIGRSLPGRTTLVVTRQPDWQADGVETCHSLEDAIARAEGFLGAGNDEIMIVGGEEIYRQCLPLADVIYLTEVDITVDGDATFPEPVGRWASASREAGVSEKSGIGYTITRLERR